LLLVSLTIVNDSVVVGQWVLGSRQLGEISEKSSQVQRLRRLQAALQPIRYYTATGSGEGAIALCVGTVAFCAIATLD
ncbi:MAG: hypothetical protein SAJ12_14905, partial [Jaaginema sp. PMC 1079.18]|nr:hypothetical protein [Jaaginema sp. PMC 1079.18]